MAIRAALLVALVCAVGAIETPEDVPDVAASIQAIEAGPAESTVPAAVSPSAKAWFKQISEEATGGKRTHRSKPKKANELSIHTLLLNAVHKEKSDFEEQLKADPKDLQKQMDELDTAAGRKAFDVEFAKLDGKASSYLDEKAFDHAFEKLNAAADRGEPINVVDTTKSGSGRWRRKQGRAARAKTMQLHDAISEENAPLVEHRVTYGKRNSADLIYLLLGVSILGVGVFARYKVRESVKGAALPFSKEEDPECGVLRPASNPAALEASFRQALGGTA